MKPENLQEAIISKKQTEQWIEQAELEIGNIRQYLVHIDLSPAKAKEVERLIQRYQASIVHLLDTVFHYDTSGIDSTVAALYPKLLELLGQLLSLIEYRYRNYFNQHEKVPDSYLVVSKGELRNKCKSLVKQLDRKGYEKKLVQLCMKPIQQFVEVGASHYVSYIELMYMKTLAEQLEEVSDYKQNNTIYNKLVVLLVYMNCNGPWAANYILELLAEDVNRETDPSKSLEKLALNRKQLMQMHEKPGVALRLKLPSLKEQLCTWIAEEMFFLETKKQLLFTVPPAKDGEEALEEGWITSLSVQQLAIYLRSAKDSEMLLNKNQTALLKTAAKVYRTKHVEKISPESLRVKYYVVEEAAKDAVIGKLKEMIRHITTY